MSKIEFPDVKLVNELELARAAEFLVCAELTLKGHPSFPSAAGLRYDAIADVDGRPIKIQVKATRGPRPVPQRAKYHPAYLFHLRKCGRGGRSSYAPGDFDMIALVALDTRTIGYLVLGERWRQTLHIKPERLSEMTFEAAFAELLLSRLEVV